MGENGFDLEVYGRVLKNGPRKDDYEIVYKRLLKIQNIAESQLQNWQNGENPEKTKFLTIYSQSQKAFILLKEIESSGEIKGIEATISKQEQLINNIETLAAQKGFEIKK
jgi:hypothetical protein